MQMDPCADCVDNVGWVINWRGLAVLPRITLPLKKCFSSLLFYRRQIDAHNIPFSKEPDPQFFAQV